MNHTMKFIVGLLLLVWVGMPLSAQKKADTAYRFRFVAENYMFFSSWSGNGQELERQLSAIEKNRSAIDARQIFLLVTSHVADGNGRQSAAEVARVCRLRVKSELITRGKVKEQYFIIDKVYEEANLYADGTVRRNVVIVTLPVPVEKVEAIAEPETAAKVKAYNKEISGEAERERLVAEEKVKPNRLLLNR